MIKITRALLRHLNLTTRMLHSRQLETLTVVTYLHPNKLLNLLLQSLLLLQWGQLLLSLSDQLFPMQTSRLQSHASSVQLHQIINLIWKWRLFARSFRLVTDLALQLIAAREHRLQLSIFVIWSPCSHSKKSSSKIFSRSSPLILASKRLATWNLTLAWYIRSYECI